MSAKCEYCENYLFDDELEVYYCGISLDEDEMERFMTGSSHDCNYFKLYDEYKMVQKQN